MWLVEGSRLCDSSGGLLWVRDKRRGDAVSNGIRRIFVLPLVDQSCSLELISTCICMCQPEAPSSTFCCLLIQSRASFAPRYMQRHLTGISQSKFVTVERPCSKPYWIRGRNKWLLKAGKQGDLLKGIFIIDNTERAGHRQFIHSLQLQAHSWLTA